MKQFIQLGTFFCIFFMMPEFLHTDNGAFTFYYGAAQLSATTLQINMTGSYAFYNNTPYNYTPTGVSTSVPMIKIVASNLIIDFNNIGVTNTDTTHAGWTGIEIGWTPAELAANPALVQPNNIIIKNLSLYNFDAAILIHAGVQSVTIQNCYFYDIVLGIGVLGTATNLCQNVNVNNVSMFGYGLNFHTALMNIKTLIETTYNYGTNYFMPFQPDPLNSGSVDVSTYFGMWVSSLLIGSFNSVGIHQIGYQDYLTVSEGNGQRSEGVALHVQQSTRLNMNNIITSEVFSEVKAVGLQLDGATEVTIQNSSFSYNTSATQAVGIEVINSNSLPYSVQALTLEGVEAKSNNATSGTAIGLNATSVRGLHCTDLTCKYNVGAIQAFGIYSTNLYTVDIRNSTLSENSASQTANTVATNQGIVAAAFYGVNVDSMQVGNVDFSSIQALNSAYGLYLNSSTSCQFTNCRFVANIATMMRSGEAAAIRSQQDAQEISKYGPCVAAASTGGYGAYMAGCKYIKFEECEALSNTGHRAIGFYAQNSQAIALWDSFASTQNATGQMLDSSFLTDNVANPGAISILPVHIPLLFGDFTKSHVDAVTTTDLFLSNIGTIRAAQLAGTTPAYSNVTAMLATSALLQSMIARYRIWSVAFGVQAHNVTGFLLKNCTCVGQVSLFDSAVGICFTGRNGGHVVDNCDLAFNVGAYASMQTPATSPSSLYTNSYNLLGFELFWNTLFMNKTPWSLADTTSVGASVTCMSFSPDGSMLAVGASDTNVRIYSTSNWALTQTLTGHTTPIQAVAWRPDGTQLASGDTAASNNIKIWNTSTWLNVENLTQTSGTVYAFAWSPDSTQLASGGTGGATNIIIWNSSAWTASQNLAHGSATVQALAWSPDGTTLVSGSSDTSNNMMVWNTSTWLSTNTLSGHSNSVTSLSYNEAGTLLASGSADTTVNVWSTTAWTVSQTLSGSAGVVNAVKFKPDGKLIAAGYANNSVIVWKTTIWGAIEATLTDATNSVLCLDWNFNGHLLATGSSDDSYRIYNTNIWKQAATTTAVGIYTGSSNYIAQDSLVFGSAINGNSVFVDLKGTQRNLVSPIGPVGAGLVMGDFMLEGLVQDCKMFGNLGNSGHSYGVVLDKAFSITLENNFISGNITNAHGNVSGILDVTTSSPNLYMENMLDGNKCSIYNNANYIVPFNPADSNVLAFPAQIIMNGKFLGTATTLYDNIVTEYSLDPTFYPFESLTSNPIDSNLRAYMTTNDCWS